MSEYYPKLKSKYFTVEYLTGNYGYDDWGFWVTCEGSIPQAIVAFLDGENFEDVIRNAVGIGGDSDTIGAMAGSIAEAYFGVPYRICRKIYKAYATRSEQLKKRELSDKNQSRKNRS